MTEQDDSAVRRRRWRRVDTCLRIGGFLSLVLACSLATTFMLFLILVTRDNWLALPPGGVPEMMSRIVSAFISDPGSALALFSSPGFLGVVLAWTVTLFGARIAIFGTVSFSNRR